MIDIKQALEAGAALAEPETIDGNKYIVIPHEYDVKSLEEFQEAPSRIKKRIIFSDADSFVKYFNKFKNEDSVIFCQHEQATFTGVIDANAKDKPAHEEHKVTYQPIFSRQYNAWDESDGKGMSQESFTSFIEKNLLDIIEPDSADLLEISRGLQAKKSINFVSGIRLADGSHQIAYEEEVKGTSAKGNIKIPEEFTVGFPIFKNGEGYKLKAKLRYRIKEAQLVIWYELQSKEQALEDAIKSVTESIAEKTNSEIFNTL